MEKISKNNSYNTCTCKNNFNGSHCSVPASIWKIHESNSQKKSSGLKYEKNSSIYKFFPSSPRTYLISKKKI